MKTQRTKLMAYLGLLAAFMVLSVFTQAQTTDTSTFKPSGHVTSQVFGDYYYKIHADSGNYHKGSTQYAGTSYPQNFSAFDLRPQKKGYDYDISRNFSASVTFAYEGDVDAKNDRIPYLKYANITWKNIFKGSNLVVGAQKTIAFSLLEENVWGYRSIEKTIMDMRGIAGSNDVGAALEGHFDNSSNYGYDVMISNGLGVVSDATINPTTAPLGANIFKKFSGDLWGKFADQKLTVQLYGDYYRTQLQPYQQSKATLKAFVAYQSKPITVGVSVFEQIQQNAAIKSIVPVPTVGSLNDTVSATPFGLSIFVHGPIVKKLGFFARYDTWNADDSYTTGDVYVAGANPITQAFIVGGLDYSPIKNVHFMPNIWVDTYSQAATSSLKSGNVVTTDYSGKKSSDNDIVLRLTFFWTL